MYQEIQPHPLLLSMVDCYWTIESDVAANKRGVFPDGCMDLIFNLGDPLFTSSLSGKMVNKNKSFIVGNMTGPIWTQPLGRVHLIGIRFKAGGIGKVVRFPLDELTDSMAALEDIDKIRLEHLCKSVHAYPERWKEIFDRFLLGHLSPVESTWEWALDLIHSNAGSISVSAVSNDCNVSVKQLERLFKKHVGLPPKLYCSVIRFKETLKKLDRSDDLLTLAVQLGYTDHAHLTKSFKNFTGMTPSEYRSQLV